MEEEYKGPYWRSNGAIFVVLNSLRDTINIIEFIKKENITIDPLLDTHFFKYKTEEEFESEEALEEFGNICEHLWELQSKLECLVNTTILMSCIELESEINKFCFFNIGEIATEAIETLSLLNKMEVVHSILGLPNFKGTQQYASLKSLISWRNAYAHGKCTDRPIKSLRKNHLESPEKYPDVNNDIERLIKHLKDFLNVSNHLFSISKHDYTSGYSTECYEIEELLSSLANINYDDLGNPI